MGDGFASSEGAALQTSDKLMENGMDTYYPDFSDMHDEKFKFWDFLGEDEFSSDFIPFNDQRRSEEESDRSKHNFVEAEENKLDSGEFWDFLSSSDDILRESCPQLKSAPPGNSQSVPDSNLFYDSPSSDSKHISNFWDFINSPDYFEKSISDSQQHFAESSSKDKHVDPPKYTEKSPSTAADQTNETHEKTQEKKDSFADDFWDFLDSGDSAGVDDKGLLRGDALPPEPCLMHELKLPLPSRNSDSLTEKSEMQIVGTFTSKNEVQLPRISSVYSLKSFPDEHSNSKLKQSSQLNSNKYRTNNLVQETHKNKLTLSSTGRKTWNKKRTLTESAFTKRVINDVTGNRLQFISLNGTMNTNLSDSIVHERERSGKIHNSHETLHTLPVSTEKVGTKKDDVKQLCLVLPETLRHPNYSHFFVVLNSSSQAQQVNFLQNAPVTNMGSNAMFLTTNNSFIHDVQNSSVTKEKEAASSENLIAPYNEHQSEGNKEFERNKYLAGFRNNYVSNLNNRKRRNENKPSLDISNGITAKNKIPLSSEILKGEDFNNVLSQINAQTASKSKLEIIPNVSGHLKNKQTKPIKRISLGKHKNAIQQINTPIKLDDLVKGRKPAREPEHNLKINEFKMPNPTSLEKSAEALTKPASAQSRDIAHLMNKSHSDLLQVSEPFHCHLSGNNPIKISTIALSDKLNSHDSIHPPNKLAGAVVHARVQIAACVENGTPVPSAAVSVMADSAMPISLTLSQPGVPRSCNQVGEIQPEKGIEINQRTIYKLKNRRKTVKELLQERQQNSGTKKSQINKREVKVLRPLCKIPTTQQASDRTKRPNIMIIPSASNPSELGNRRKKPLILSVSPLDISSPLPFCKNDEDGRGRRPRYYDLSELQVGYFKVEDDVDATGRFRSKFKVIFTKCQLLYDFPVSRCNQPELKRAEANDGQIARITIPFRSIASMSMRDRFIYISVNDTPHISLGIITSRSGKFSNVYETDATWRDLFRSTFTHKVVLRKRQAGKLRASLCQFDTKFVSLTSTSAHGSVGRGEKDPYVFGSEVSLSFQDAAKNKKSCIRRLPQWDPSGEQKSEEDLLINQVCSCRTNCRYVRCSCVKAAKSCSFSGSMCQCINCNNPLNVLETIGMDIDFSIQDTCLFQNIYQIPELLNYLQREVRLECCKSFARVQDCIPGTVLCPNIDCDTRLEFSWCHRVVCYPEYNPRNHCSFCGQCRFSSKYHCFTCKRCYAVSAKSTSCPRCEKEQVVAAVFSANKSSSKQNSKPEIIVLQSSVSKESSKEITPPTLS